MTEQELVEFCREHRLDPPDANMLPIDLFRSLAGVAMVAAGAARRLEDLERRLGQRPAAADDSGRRHGDFGWTRGETRPAKRGATPAEVVAAAAERIAADKKRKGRG